MKVVTFGEVMLRLAAPQNLRFSQAVNFEATFGGGEANVAVSLANYKIPVDFVSRIPKNDIGESCIMNLKKYGVGTNHMLRGGEAWNIFS
jgi:2-dehydro-3-deoxygluconokinase